MTKMSNLLLFLFVSKVSKFKLYRLKKLVMSLNFHFSADYLGGILIKSIHCATVTAISSIVLLFMSQEDF